MTTRDKVNKAFRELRKAGYYAKQNYWCCQNCAWNDIPEESVDKAVFYHNQDNEAWYGKELKKSLFLAWSGDANEIISILVDAGLEVSWNGNENKRIEILKTLDK